MLVQLDPRKARPIDLLLVEDSPSDRLITAAAIEQSRLKCTLHVVENGLEAMAFLRKNGKYTTAPTPDLVLLDLNMPQMDGRDVLAEIKADPGLRRIPVVVLSTSSTPEDIQQAYDAHANSYIAKPADFMAFNDALSAFGEYWLNVVTLAPDRVAPRQEPAALAPTDTQAVSVLLVEDSPTDALLLKSVIAQVSTPARPCTVTHVERLSDAVRFLREHPCSIILTDLGLPDTQGLSTVRELRRAAGDAPILVLTGCHDEALGEAALRTGAEDYFTKDNFTSKTLSRAMTYALERSRSRVALRRGQRARVVGQLAGGVSHDFNNLLTVIHSGAELLRDGLDPDGVAEVAKDLLDAARRGSALTRQLASLGRHHPFEPNQLDTHALVRDLTPLLKRLVGPSVRLDLNLGPAIPGVWADPNTIEQVLLNLASNAGDAMPCGGTIRLSTTLVDVGAAQADSHAVAPGRFARVEVTDDGTGIPADVVPHIFEPFFTTKPGGRGTGLGLASAAEIVQQHGGFMTVRSAMGVGTTIGVMLPIAEGQQASPASPTAETESASLAPAPHRAQPAQVLLVEDENYVRSAITRLLQRAGHEVTAFDNGEAALNYWRKNPTLVDLVFTDLVMPGAVDGAELGRRIRALDPDVPIVYCSGFSTEFSDPTVALSRGTNFLHKPFEKQELLAVVASALQGGAKTPWRQRA